MADVDARSVAGSRTYRHHHLDSTRWEHVAYRPDDIVVSTPYKSGTTWTLKILAALLHGPESPPLDALSPWIDARFRGPVEEVAAEAEAQEHRRVLKSHLALDGLRWDDDVRWIVVGRDLRDVFMSFLNHYGAYTDFMMELANGGDRQGPPLPRAPDDPHLLWRDWIGRGWFDWEQDGWPFWSAFHHFETWWPHRDLPNVLLVHYADLLADPVTETARIAAFCEIDVSETRLHEVVQETSFRAMKDQALAAEAERGGPGEKSAFAGGVATFMHKGTNGRWRDLLTTDELAQYDARAARLDPVLRSWLEAGRHAIGLT